MGGQLGKERGNMRILIVEDEVLLAQTLAEILSEQRYAVDVVHDGVTGYDYASSGQYDAVVLDIMLPAMDGLELLSRLRRERDSTPVLILTAKAAVADKVQGLDAGADDYLTKPFSPEELLARVRAISRRTGEMALDELAYGDISLQLSACTLCRGNKSVRLGYKEFEVLRILMVNSSMIVPKEDLLVKVWGVDSNAVDNNVEAYISFLRKKLAFLESQVHIHSARKVGYYLEVGGGAA